VINPAQIIITGGSPLTVNGEGFPSGTVNLTLDGAQAGAVNAPNGEFVQTPTTPGNQNSYETVTVKATGSGILASLAFTTTPPPK
jgi:hypothetical protein